MKRHTIPRPADREAWLEARRPYIGASEGAVVLGRSPYRTAGDLAAEHLGHGPPQPHSAAMERGNRLEAVVADWWADEHGYQLADVDTLYALHNDNDEPVLIATLDRHIVERPDAALEVKTTTERIGSLPPHWEIQAHCQMMCADLVTVEFAVFDGTMGAPKSFTVERDYDQWHRIFYRCDAFMAHIRDGRMPPNSERSERSVDDQYATPTTTRVDLDGKVRPLLEELAELDTRKKLIDAQAEKRRAAIKCYLGDGTDGYLDDILAVTWRAQTSHGVDVKALRKDMPHVAAKYAKDTTYRKFLPK